MNRKQRIRLRALIEEMQWQLEVLEWFDREAIEQDFPPDRECDGSFDYIPGVCVAMCALDEDDEPDESDHASWPICVECGNFSPSCVC